MTPKEFTTKFAPFAKETERKYGISHLFILAHAALESNWGKSAPGNMFFGVKASKSTPENKRQLLTTTEVFRDDKQGYRFPQVLSITKRSDGKYTYKVKDWFRKYDTPGGCFTDHAKFFFENRRYANALKVKENPELFADEIAKAGYATDPNYARVLRSVIGTIRRSAS